jgi:uncharacterized protein YhfF
VSKATPDPARLISLLAEDGFVVPAAKPLVGDFGDSRELSEELLALVCAGSKTATSSLPWSWEADGDPVARSGDLEMVVDWDGLPAAVIEYTEVFTVPFLDVPADFARDEGEGDLSLEAWREGHRRFFTRECARLGREASDEMPVVCTRFRVLYVVRARRHRASPQSPA